MSSAGEISEHLETNPLTRLIQGQGNTSGYIADLIERDRRRDELRAMFARHGYTGAKAITDEGAATMGDRLHQLREQRAAQRGQHAV